MYMYLSPLNFCIDRNKKNTYNSQRVALTWMWLFLCQTAAYQTSVEQTDLSATRRTMAITVSITVAPEMAGTRWGEVCDKGLSEWVVVQWIHPSRSPENWDHSGRPKLEKQLLLCFTIFKATPKLKPLGHWPGVVLISRFLCISTFGCIGYVLSVCFQTAGILYILKG